MILSTTTSFIALWHFPLIMIKLFDLHMFKITQASMIALALKKLPKRSTIIGDKTPKGLIYGWMYIGYVSDNSETGASELYILTTTKFYESITQNNTDDDPNKKKQFITIYERRGTFNWLRYTERKLNVTKYIPRPNQIELIDKIVGVVKEKESCVVLIHGLPGSGKSIISLLLAKQLNGSYCDAFNPTDPGDTFSLLYNTVDPTEDSPLVVIFEEVDKKILKIHEEIPQHKNIPISVRDKGAWNLFFDKIDRGMYPHLVFIMTTNQDPTFITELDPAYIRPGRVDFIYHMEQSEKTD
jgi:hypothetical protein